MPWEKPSTPWELSSTASIFDGAGDRKKEMLRKKYHVVRKKTHVVRKIFYVASIFDGEASRQNRPPGKLFVKPNEQRQSREDLSDAMARKGRMKSNFLPRHPFHAFT